MRSETQRRGELAKCKVMFRAYEKGIIVSEPTVDADYDLVLDVERRLWRCQVKYTSSPSSNSIGAVQLSLRRTTRNRKELVYTIGDIDAILVYLAPCDTVLWLPEELWDGKTSLQIRYREAKNRQKSRIIWYKDYEW